ncbi:hypothetical protein [Coxiella burnetii]|nr:hypothetical protein [Coxiella burnetii]OYK90553.1 hypothetical protein CbuQ195_06410 [Coxiella burnetii]PNT79224.1 hypothetical protein C2L92_07575 [Coxiella burnetii]PNT80362.1 hypothetical protein C2L91_07680 [Coxiella burnetii]PNT83569.1 hypothetical protein C2L90_07635 [Coxiella burnetii]PNT87406.1 hypothetical protein C2L94_07115 [Coxiella burnetii]
MQNMSHAVVVFNQASARLPGVGPKVVGSIASINDKAFILVLFPQRL